MIYTFSLQCSWVLTLEATSSASGIMLIFQLTAAVISPFASINLPPQFQHTFGFSVHYFTSSLIHIITTSIPVCSSCVMVWFNFSATSLLTYLPHCCLWPCAITCGSFRCPPSIDFSCSIFSFHAILVMFLWSFQYVIRKVFCCAPRLSLLHIIMVLRLAFMEWMLPHTFTACWPFHIQCICDILLFNTTVLFGSILFASDQIALHVFIKPKNLILQKNTQYLLQLSMWLTVICG